MKQTSPAPQAVSGKLPKAARRQQLLAVALLIVRQEGADRLTLGHVATRAGVSKPIAYEHFGSRARLLAELYQALDQQQVQALLLALQSGPSSLAETAAVLASTYIHCAVDTSGEIYAVRAALSGSEELGAVQQQALAGYVDLFVAALVPHSALPAEELHRRCVGLVGAGEALSLRMVGGQCGEQAAAATFSALIQGGLQAPASPANAPE